MYQTLLRVYEHLAGKWVDTGDSNRSHLKIECKDTTIFPNKQIIGKDWKKLEKIGISSGSGQQVICDWYRTSDAPCRNYPTTL